MDALTLVSLLCHGAAATMYLVYHVGAREPVARLARLALAVGVLLQAVDIGLRCVRGLHPASSVSEAMAFSAWMISSAVLVASLRYRLQAVGAFAVPASVVLLLLARVVPGGAAGGKPGLLGMVHVFLSTLGVATFALAAGIGALYLVQERRLKRHQIGRARGAGAPLDTLDRLAARCVSVGFPVFTLAIVTGAVWVARLGIVQGHHPVRLEYLAALASWIAFGTLLVARFGSGWQGRRAAWLTVGGFAGVVLVVLGYFIRAAV